MDALTTKKVVFLSNVAAMVSVDQEAMRVNYIDVENGIDEEPVVYATGEESGDEYSIPLSEIDFPTTIFYEMNMIKFKE